MDCQAVARRGLCLVRVTLLVTALLLQHGRKDVATTHPYAVLGARDLSCVWAELAERPGWVCLGTLGEEGANQLQGAGTSNLAAETLEARLIFPGCPGADVAVSHHILLGRVWGPKTLVRAAVQVAGGRRDGFLKGPGVPTLFPSGSGTVFITQGRVCGAGGILPVARTRRVLG